MPYWLPVSECVLATVSFSHALPREKSGVGGLWIQQRQENLVLPEITGGLHNKLIIQDYTHLLVINNFSLINFDEMQDKMSQYVSKQGVHTCSRTHSMNWT